MKRLFFWRGRRACSSAFESRELRGCSLCFRLFNSSAHTRTRGVAASHVLSAFKPLAVVAVQPSARPLPRPAPRYTPFYQVAAVGDQVGLIAAALPRCRSLRTASTLCPAPASLSQRAPRCYRRLPRCCSVVTPTVPLQFPRQLDIEGGIPPGTGLGYLFLCRSYTPSLLPLHSSQLLTVTFFFFRRGRCSSPVMAATEVRDRPYARMLDGQYQLIRSFTQYHRTLTAVPSRFSCCAVCVLASSRFLRAAMARLRGGQRAAEAVDAPCAGVVVPLLGALGSWWALHWLCTAVGCDARAVGRSVGVR